MKITGFKNSKIYVAGKGIVQTGLAIRDGKIAEISSSLKDDDFVELPQDKILVPGFIDEHIHGARGADAMDGKYSSLKTIATALPEEGVTSFNFTTMTMSKDVILKALSAIKDYLSKPQPGAYVMGVHLEGPFICKEFCGAQNPDDILPLDVPTLEEFIAASGNHIKELTFSYDPSHKDFIDCMLAHHIAPSLGHTDNTSDLALEAISLGVHLGTHTFNAMKGIHHREIGTAGALLISDDVSCELIADLHHVSANAIRLLYRCKGKDRITLITDSMEAKFLPDGMYALGGNPVVVKDGTARLENGTLAGSILHLNDAIRNVRTVLGLPLVDVIDMATINPARNMSVAESKGSIAVGKDADFTLIDDDVRVYETIRGGEVIYQR